MAAEVHIWQFWVGKITAGSSESFEFSRVTISRFPNLSNHFQTNDYCHTHLSFTMLRTNRSQPLQALVITSMFPTSWKSPIQHLSHPKAYTKKLEAFFKRLHKSGDGSGARSGNCQIDFGFVAQSQQVDSDWSKLIPDMVMESKYPKPWKIILNINIIIYNYPFQIPWETNPH